jgi:hypothetical protein
MNSTAELGAEMLVWLQVYHATDKKVWGVGAEVNDFAEKQVKRLLDAAKAQGI